MTNMEKLLKHSLFLLVLGSLFLSACSQSGGASGDSSIRANSDGSCTSSAGTLDEARDEFRAECGAEPRDCDPIGDGWTCSSDVIGENAPPNNSTPSYACTATGATLADAREAFQEQCNSQPLDCDPVGNQWMCSSEQIGDYAPPQNADNLNTQLRTLLNAASGGRGVEAFRIPDSHEFPLIPQDPNNQLSHSKVELGKLLYHDTAFGLEGRGGETQSWSCATCHHAAAGFKSGVKQGIANGGIGFGMDGSERFLALGFDANAETDSDVLPDIQPLASPTILNSAYQAVMLWNGQFGNGDDSAVNSAVPDSVLMTPGTPKEANELGLSGLETQAVAGTGVHRLRFHEDSPLQTVPEYMELFSAAYPAGSNNVLRDAGKAIAAYERTVLANQAPFQLWIRGDEAALTDREKRGAMLFFGDAGCSSCHTGPALSSNVGAVESELFMAIGFADFDNSLPDVHGPVSLETKQGRGGFTGDESSMFTFKIPPLYNLADSRVFGHGSSFGSLREVLEYKNSGIPQSNIPVRYLDSRFVPLNLTSSELVDLESFLTTGLYDVNLMRYQPDSVPSGACVVVEDNSVPYLCP